MAKKYDPGKYERKTVSRRSKRYSIEKTLPGSEAVWDKTDNSNLSIVEKTNIQLEQKFLGKYTDRSRRKTSRHKSNKYDMMPVTNITTEVLFNSRGKGPVKPYGVERFDKIRDIGPGNSIRGISDNSQNTIYADEYKIYETLYGRRLAKNNVKKQR